CQRLPRPARSGQLRADRGPPVPSWQPPPAGTAGTLLPGAGEAAGAAGTARPQRDHPLRRAACPGPVRRGRPAQGGQARGHRRSALILCAEHRALGLFAVADQLKERSREAIAELHRLGVRTLMLSGDNPHTAAAIGAEAGIDEVRGNLLPTDKLAEIDALARPP